MKQRTKTKPTIGPLKDTSAQTVTDTVGMAPLLNKTFNAVFTREDTGVIPGCAGTQVGQAGAEQDDFQRENGESENTGTQVRSGSGARRVHVPIPRTTNPRTDQF
jgi:hypothetical protein